MFKKITALLLLTAFTNVYAFSPIDQIRSGDVELNKTFDSLNYKLNVEWDQKDAKFFDEAVAGFEKDITDLQKDGLTQEDLMKYTVEQVKSNEIKNEINELAKIISQSKMTNDEARAFAISKLNSTYSEGANWSGSRHRHGSFICCAVIIILILAHHYNHPDDEPTPTQNGTYELQ